MRGAEGRTVEDACPYRWTGGVWRGVEGAAPYRVQNDMGGRWNMPRWLMERVLPVWAKESLLAENRALRREKRRLENRVQVLESYVRGLHRGMGRRKD